MGVQEGLVDGREFKKHELSQPSQMVETKCCGFLKLQRPALLFPVLMTKHINLLKKKQWLKRLYNVAW